MTGYLRQPAVSLHCGLLFAIKMKRLVFLFSALAFVAAPVSSRAQDTTAPVETEAPTETPSAGGGTTDTGSSMIFPTGPTSGSSGTASPLPTGAGATPPTGNAALGAGVQSATVPSAAPTTLSLPGGYGFVPKTFTLGEGRFAQPPVKFNFSVSQGYDDNVFSTPTHPVTSSASAAPTQPTKTQKREPVVIIGGPFGIKIITIPEPKAVDQPTVQVNPTEPQQKVGSAVTNARVGMEMQAANPRTAFTLDLSVGALYYWSRPGDAADYNGSFGMTYLHRMSQRLTLTAEADAVYQSQPDFSRINTPTSEVTNGSYLSANAKIDLAYQFRPRVATVTSYSLNTTIPFTNSTDSNFYLNTIGTQLRYQYSPRVTYVGEVREAASSYPATPDRDSESSFLLIGADVAFTQRLNATTRVGEEILTPQTGSAQASPYIETSTTYVFLRNSTLQWTNRFGFEEAPSSSQRSLSYRTGLNVNEVISARLTASLGLAYNHVNTDALSGGGDVTTQQQLQGNFGLQYVVSRTISLNANYTYTQLISNTPGTDYRRNQIFLGANYSF